MISPVSFGSQPGAALELASLRILCLGAHSDDIEIGCGGTLLKLLERHPGSTVHWIVFSSTSEREREARASAADFLQGAGETTVAVHGFRESFFPVQWEAIKQTFEKLRRAFEPQLVFSHHRLDQHQDHRVLAELTWNTFRDHTVLEYEIAKYEGDLGHPNLFVPLTRAQADRKVALLLEHFSSQAGRSWFRPDTFHGLMSVRAVECNAPEARAEAFHVRKLVL